MLPLLPVSETPSSFHPHAQQIAFRRRAENGPAKVLALLI